jgi:uncharacterized peroxidase-related enzyme
MPRIKQLDAEQTKGWTGRLFRKVSESLGLVPNMFACMGNSAMALEGFLTLNGNLGAGKLGGKLIKQIILATSELNGCEYCVSAHTQMAKDAVLLDDEECLSARKLMGTDDKSTAALKFVGKVHEAKGKVDDQAIQTLRNNGFQDEEIVEILATMALATFANYISNVGEPELDYPEVPTI